MKTGLISFSDTSPGVLQLIESLITGLLSHRFEVSSIYLNEEKNKIEICEYALSQLKDFAYLRLHSSPLPRNTMLLEKACQDFGRVLFIGGNETNEVFERITQKMPNKDFLFVPISAYNDIVGDEGSLGYDTAINNITEEVLKIQDTINSLKYPHPRLFGIRLLGKAPRKMFEDLALATGGEFLEKNNRQQAKAVETSLTQKFFAGTTYSFLFFDETLPTDFSARHVFEDLQVDWKKHEIDPLVSFGAYPSATDRILAKKLAGEAVSWLKERKGTGKLTVGHETVGFAERKNYHKV